MAKQSCIHLGLEKLPPDCISYPRLFLTTVAAMRIGAHVVVAVTANSEKASIAWCGKIIFGGAEGTRTPDFLRAKEALSQLSYSPISKNYYSNKGSYSQFASMA